MFLSDFWVFGIAKYHTFIIIDIVVIQFVFRKEKEKIRAFGTFASEKNECILESYEVEAPALTEWENCLSVPEMPSFTLFGQMDIRLDPICTGWIKGNLSAQSEIKGWIKFKDSRAFDTLSLLLIADSFPLAVFSSQGMVAWVPTLEFSVNIRNKSIINENWRLRHESTIN